MSSLDQPNSKMKPKSMIIRSIVALLRAADQIEVLVKHAEGRDKLALKGEIAEMRLLALHLQSSFARDDVQIKLIAAPPTSKPTQLEEAMKNLKDFKPGNPA